MAGIAGVAKIAWISWIAEVAKIEAVAGVAGVADAANVAWIAGIAGIANGSFVDQVVSSCGLFRWFKFRTATGAASVNIPGNQDNIIRCMIYT